MQARKTCYVVPSSRNRLRRSAMTFACNLSARAIWRRSGARNPSVQRPGKRFRQASHLRAAIRHPTRNRLAGPGHQRAKTAKASRSRRQNRSLPIMRYPLRKRTAANNRVPKTSTGWSNNIRIRLVHKTDFVFGRYAPTRRSSQNRIGRSTGFLAVRGIAALTAAGFSTSRLAVSARDCFGNVFSRLNSFGVFFGTTSSASSARMATMSASTSCVFPISSPNRPAPSPTRHL